MAEMTYSQGCWAEVGKPRGQGLPEGWQVAESGCAVRVSAPLPTAPSGAGGAPTEEQVAAWVHSRSGLSFPRLSMLTYAATGADYEALAAGSVRRGLSAADRLQARKVRRSAAEEAALHAFCGWLAEYGLDVIGTVTFSPKYADDHGIVSLERAIDDVRRGLAQCGMRHGRKKGFQGRYVLAGEWHPSGRQVPHVHLALESRPWRTDEDVRSLWSYFFGTRGRSRFEVMRDVDRATLYGLKDTIKASQNDATSSYLRLAQPRL
jgi:hypothetical protein